MIDVWGRTNEVLEERMHLVNNIQGMHTSDSEENIQSRKTASGQEVYWREPRVNQRSDQVAISSWSVCRSESRLESRGSICYKLLESKSCTELFWTVGKENFKQFSVIIGELKTRSLTLTKEVIEEQMPLETTVQGLQILSIKLMILIHLKALRNLQQICRPVKRYFLSAMLNWEWAER